MEYCCHVWVGAPDCYLDCKNRYVRPLVLHLLPLLIHLFPLLVLQLLLLLTQ